MIRWQGWGAAACARAREEKKPLLLALTAAWCHACHRMDEETWEEPGVAATVEARTVPVRVDADERPDVYARYHLGGLPTTALLTPEGEFIRGGTFLSPTGLLALLDAGLGDWVAGRRPGRRGRTEPAAPDDLVAATVARLLRRAAREHGGFGAAPKLPEVEAVTLLLRHWRAGGDADLEPFLRLTLDAIARHLHDPVDGGFFRYAAGADWSGPHTEKLAVDQGLLIRLFLEAGPALGEPRYVEVASQALAHARRRLFDGSGGWFASIAADPDYYAGPRPASEEDMPAVDRRRFADASAALGAAAALAAAVSGEPPGSLPAFIAVAPEGWLLHRLEEPGGIRGLLRDQALGLAAAVLFYRLTGDSLALDWARRAADWSLAHLWEEQARAFRAAPDPPEGEPGLPALHPVLPNGEMALALVELAAHAGEASYGEHARRTIQALAGPALASPAGAALALAAQRLAGKPPEAELEGELGDPRAQALARVVVAAFGPTAVVRWKAGPRPAVTLCIRDLCLPPLDEPQELLASLATLGVRS